MKKNVIVAIMCIALIAILGIQTRTYIGKLFNSGGDGQIRMMVDYPTATNLSEMKDGSDFIAQGNFKRFDKKWNAARDSQDTEKEDANANFEARVYDFEVTKVLKGDLDKNIKFTLIYSRKIQGFDKAVVDEYFEEPEYDKPVVLFLKKDELTDYFYPALFPYQLEKNHMGNYKITTKNRELTDAFENQDIAATSLE